MTTTCRLATHPNTVGFAQQPWPPIPAHLRRDPRCLASKMVTAILVALLPLPYQRRWQAVYLLVEPVASEEYRLVGMCCDSEHSPDGEKGWNQRIQTICKSPKLNQYWKW